MLRSSALTDASLCQATAQQAPVWLRARCLEAREEFQGLWAVNLSPESSVHSVIYCSHISLVWPAFTLTETFFFFSLLLLSLSKVFQAFFLEMLLAPALSAVEVLFY